MSIRAATTAYFEQYVGLAGGHAESVVIPGADHMLGVSVSSPRSARM